MPLDCGHTIVAVKSQVCSAFFFHALPTLTSPLHAAGTEFLTSCSRCCKKKKTLSTAFLMKLLFHFFFLQFLSEPFCHLDLPASHPQRCRILNLHVRYDTPSRIPHFATTEGVSDLWSKKCFDTFVFHIKSVFPWLLFLLRVWHFWLLATALQTSSAPSQRFHTLTRPDWPSVPYLVSAPPRLEAIRPQEATSKQTLRPSSARPLTSAGAGIFVTTVVAGSVALVKPFTVASRPFLRDVIFYMAAVFWTFFILYRKTTTFGETFGTRTQYTLD